MRDKKERQWFLTWAKEQYHAEEYQQKRQQEDEDLGGKSKRRQGMKSRWDRELQRRLGTAPLWLMVSFTGRLDVSFLNAADGSPQTVEAEDEAKKREARERTNEARKARDRLRYAQSLARKKSRGKKKDSLTNNRSCSKSWLQAHCTKSPTTLRAGLDGDASSIWTATTRTSPLMVEASSEQCSIMLLKIQT